MLRTPRQRTFTSCTECRRRKQKCNQAKDRPCNNCSRLYPPVVCTYQSSSSIPPPHDRFVDLQDENEVQADQTDYQQPAGRADQITNPAFVQPSQSYYDGNTAAAAPSSQQTYGSSQGYYSTHSTTRGDYRGYPSGSASSQHITSSDTDGYVTGEGGYYQQGQMSFNSMAQSHDIAYYPTSDEQGEHWLSPSGDPSAFVGAGSSENYYVNDEFEHSRSAPPRR